MRTIVSTLLACSLLAPLGAQRLAVYGPIVGNFVEVQPPTWQLQAVEAAVPPVLGYATAPLLPPMPPFGDATCDHIGGLLWYTDGLTLAAMPSPSVPPAGPVPPPVPIAPPVLAITGGPVTAIAYDSVAGVMFLSGPLGPIVGVLPNPAMPIVVQPFAIPWPTGPIAGLDWDGATGSLFAVDLPGIVYNFFPGGGPIGVPLAPPILLPAPAGDVAVDRTLRGNLTGARPIYVAFGTQVIDVNDPNPTLFSAGTLAEGLAFLNFPASNPPNATCPCPGTSYPSPLLTTGPMTVGNPAFGLGHGGLPPGFPMLFLFEVGGLTNLAYPWFNAIGCGIGLLPGSAGIVTLSATADPAGNAIVPLNLAAPTLPLGTSLFMQALTFCAADPVFGLVFTPMSSIYVSSV